MPNYEEYEDWEHKKGVPKELLYLLFSFYETQPIAGAVRATGVLSAAARSRGKLCAFLSCITSRPRPPRFRMSAQVLIT
jgi:hypothetical protein